MVVWLWGFPLQLRWSIFLWVICNCRKDNRRDRDSKPPPEPKKFEESPTPVSLYVQASLSLWCPPQKILHSLLLKSPSLLSFKTAHHTKTESQPLSSFAPPNADIWSQSTDSSACALICFQKFSSASKYAALLMDGDEAEDLE